MDRTAPAIPALLLFDEREGDAGDETPAEFVLPPAEELTALDDAALAALEEEAVAAFDALRDGEPGPDYVTSLTALADAVDAIRGERERRETEAEASRVAAEELASRVHPADPADEAAQEGGEGEGDAGGEQEGEGGEGDAEARAAAATPPARPRPTRIPIGAIRRRAPETEVAAAGDDVVITAAGDVPGYSAGSVISDLGGVRHALTERARLLGRGGKAKIATFTLPVVRGSDGQPLTITEGMDRERQMAVLRAAAEPRGRILDEAGALTAAGGWCAPSERRYGFFPLEARTGMIDLPTVNVTRGGIEWIEDGGPQLADFMAHPWLWTEQNDIDAGTVGAPDPVKPCIRVPCPDWVEERLDAEGICVIVGNLADRAFPEMTRRTLDLVLAAHFHRMNQRRIATIEAGSSPSTVESTFGTLTAILGAGELHAWDLRDSFRMDDEAAMEVVLPSWVLGAIRSDVMRRTGVDPGTAYARRQVVADFAARNLRVQFVQDWQPLQLEAYGSTNRAVVGSTTNASAAVTALNPDLSIEDVGRPITGAGIPAGTTVAAVAANGDSLTLSQNATATAAGVALTLGIPGNLNGIREEWPERVRMLVYPPGTWELGQGGSIDLGVQRSPEQNEVNDHTAAWTEEFHLLLKAGPVSRVVTVPICTDGRNGGKPIVAGDYACPIA